MLETSEQKAALIRAVADDWPAHRTFVETGTACGDLCVALADRFDRVVSIERDVEYFRSAHRRCSHLPNVTIQMGDSADVLGYVVPAVDKAIYWLDAHEIVEDGTSALAGELGHLSTARRRPVILVDDVRLLRDEKGWVSRATLDVWARTYGYRPPVYADDVARVFPK